MVTVPRRLLLPLLAALLALAAAAPARASQAGVSGGVLRVTAAGGEVNDIAIASGGSWGVYLVTERGSLVTLQRSTQCADQGGNVLRCTGASQIAVDAGDGADRIAIAAPVTARTTLTDGAGDDTVTGGGGADTFVGSPGADTLAGGAGDDTFGDAGGEGADALDGGPGADTASYASRAVPLAVTLDGLPGDGAAAENDDVEPTVETVQGGSAADRLTGADGAEQLKGNAGDDVLDGGGGADRLQGDSGRDTADYRSRTVPVVVTADWSAGDGAAGENDNVGGDVDSLLGGSGDDDLSAGSADGTLDGGAGDDVLRAGGGDDEVLGGAGDDTIAAGDGDDVVRAGDGRDEVDGGNDEDRIDGGAGADDLGGGGGTDLVDYASRTQPVVVDLGAGTTNVDGDRLSGIDGVAGGSGDDRLRGNDWDGRLEGGAGDDVLDGRGGADRMLGGPGRDLADYGGRRSSVAVSLNDGSDDGAGGERDNVGKDVEHVVTGAGDDRISGDEDAETLAGGAGEDQLSGGAGNDLLEGGDGKDTLWPGKGDDTVRGGGSGDRIGGDDGHDALDGGPGDDRVDGERGNDTVTGGDGDDQVTGGDNEDTVDGGAGRDTVWPGKGDDFAVGGPGDDRLGGDDGNDVLDGGDGNDTVDGERGGDHVVGSAGDDKASGGDDGDRVEGGPGNDTANGGNGDDAVDGGWGSDTVDGGRGVDTLTGGDGDDKLWGGDGSDRLDAGPGRDRLGAGGGDDQVDGGPDADTVGGDDGADRIAGGDGADEVAGGGGDDVLVADPGADRLRGDAGEDTADYGGRAAALRVTNDGKADDGQAGEGDNVDSSVDHVIGGAGNDVLRLRTDWPHRIWGEGGNDVVDGGPKGDRLSGGPGNDQLIGRERADTFDGGPGADRLSGADGMAETLRCGPGRDSATRDRADKAIACEKTRIGRATGSPAPQDTVPVPATSGRLTGVKRVYRGGRFVAIPGSPGERIDRRLLKDVAYLKSRYRVAITDGLAMTGHAPGGEHPRGLAVDVIPGAGGSWSDVDRLARWAEPRQGRPRRPFRWVGYNGDRGHGRGHHLHLSWRNSGARRGRPAKWVEVLSFRSGQPTVRVRDLTPLAARTNQRLGGAPSVRTGMRSLTRCKGPGQLVGTWKAAGRAFGINWKILAAITEIESGHGCNMGPSKAGALGWTQFMPATWKRWGMDADGDGRATPFSSADAIFSSARYLRAAGAPRSYRRALWAYNHATWYVNDVLRRAKKY